VREIVADGFQPIVFCRFIASAEYLTEALRSALPAGVEVACVTGLLPAEEREQRVLDLAERPRRVLVCTDCLSEGVNLQDHFDAVVHYDLSWNPTRHEQREGRVDRFGQPRATVRLLTYFGRDNPIDGIVLDVLLRKHRTIRDSLGISVPVPVDSNAVLEAILEGLLLRGRDEQLSLFAQPGLVSARDELHGEWEQAAERERRSRTVFAQETLRPEEVARELEETRQAIGSAADVRRFLADALRAHGALVSGEDAVAVDLAEAPRALKDALGPGLPDRFRARFQLPVADGELHLTRTHPVVEGLASYVLDTALDPLADGAARRAGAIRTRAVSRRTTLLLLRFRYDLVAKRQEGDHRRLAEECRLCAFAGSPERAEWLAEEEVEALLEASPDANVTADQARDAVSRLLAGYERLLPALEEEARRRARALLEAHLRVREAARMTGVRYAVEPKLPADLLGLYVLLPAA